MSEIQNANKIIHLPFDEPSGSRTAYDYSENRYDGTISGSADFASGKNGNCLKFTGDGLCSLPYTIALTGAFTLMAWIRRDEVPSQYESFKPSKISIMFHGSTSDDNSIEKRYPINQDSWSFWTITKTGLTAKIYQDGILQEQVTLTEQPDYITIMQDGTQAETFASVDDFVIYDRVLTQDEITECMSSVAQSLKYYIDYVDIRSEWGIRFESSSGLLAKPKMKSPTKVDWPDYHGDVVDLTDKRFEARTITLKGWMPADNKNDFISKWNDFVSHFEKDGTQRLMVDVHPTKPLVYEVYLEDECDPEKTWSNEAMVGTFTLKLKEPDPVKRVIRQLVTSSDNKSIRVQMTSTKAITIAWGDGTYSEDLSGTIDVTHYYTEDGTASGTVNTGTYYAIVSGVIEDITNFSTTGIVVWNRL